MNEWFKAFNADDKEALHAFAVAHMPDMSLDGSFRAMTGGFVVKRITDPLAHERRSDRDCTEL